MISASIRSSLVACGVTVAALAPAKSASAQACCGGTPQGGLPVVSRLPGEAGTITTSLDWELRRLDTPERTSGPALAPLLDQRVRMQLFTASAELAATSWLAAALVVPVVVNHESVTLPDGKNLSGTAAGIGDIALLGKLRVLTAAEDSKFVPTVLVVGGVRAPTGPYKLQDDALGIYSPSLQPGTGAWGGLFGVSGVEPLNSAFSDKAWSLYASVIGSYSGANSVGYALGPSLAYALGAGVLLWHKLTLQAGAVGVAVAADRLNGSSVDNTGSHQLWLGPTATWTIVPHVSVYAGARFPIWRSLNGTQLVGAYSLGAGVITNFALWGD